LNCEMLMANPGVRIGDSEIDMAQRSSFFMIDLGFCLVVVACLCR
jgi:hypothetical protein